MTNLCLSRSLPHACFRMQAILMNQKTLLRRGVILLATHRPEVGCGCISLTERDTAWKGGRESFGGEQVYPWYVDSAHLKEREREVQRCMFACFSGARVRSLNQQCEDGCVVEVCDGKRCSDVLRCCRWYTLFGVTSQSVFSRFSGSFIGWTLVTAYQSRARRQ